MIRCIAIDDEPLFLKVLQSYFFDIPDAELVATYTNAVEGIMAVVKLKPDVLLLDLEMPYLDGFEAISTLDKRPKIIVISGHLDEHNISGLKIDRFLSKSDLRNPSDLEAAILAVL